MSLNQNKRLKDSFISSGIFQFSLRRNVACQMVETFYIN